MGNGTTDEEEEEYGSDGDVGMNSWNTAQARRRLQLANGQIKGGNRKKGKF